MFTVLGLVVDDGQVPSLVLAPAPGEGPVGLEVLLLALEQEALVLEAQPAWGRERRGRGCVCGGSVYLMIITFIIIVVILLLVIMMITLLDLIICCSFLNTQMTRHT